MVRAAEPYLLPGDQKIKTWERSAGSVYFLRECVHERGQAWSGSRGSECVVMAGCQPTTRIAQPQKRGSELGPNTELQLITSTGENSLGAFHDLELKAGLRIPFS